MAQDKKKDQGSNGRPRLGNGMAEKAAKAMEGRQAQLDRRIAEALGQATSKKKKDK